jgi:hypothetical protein
LKSFNPKPIIFPKIIGFTGKPPAQGVSGNGFVGLVPFFLLFGEDSVTVRYGHPQKSVKWILSVVYIVTASVMRLVCLKLHFERSGNCADFSHITPYHRR